MAMPARSRSPSSDKSYEREIAAALEGSPLDLVDQQGNAYDILGHSGGVGHSTPVSKPATGPRAPGTGSDTSYELALAAASEGEWCMAQTVYEMEPSGGSSPRQVVAAPAPAASSNCSSCGITLVKGNTF